jgi:type VI secretion system protein ImpM
VSTSVEVGFYGKLPVIGDFLSREVEPQTIARWDGWLQRSIAASQEQLGDAWLDLYLTAPMWRFFAPAGIVGNQPTAGVLLPSVDRVGRYFPLTVFARLPETATGLVVLERCSAWFERVEDLVLAQLDNEARPIEEFEALIRGSADRLLPGLEALPADLNDLGDDAGQAPANLHLALGERLDVGSVALAMLSHRLAQERAHPVLWCTSGSARIRPSWLITDGLPDPAAFTAMLSGTWHDWPWTSRERLAAASLAGQPSLRFESAGSSHTGNVRSENQDAFVARPEVGLWLVADGMGGHADGHVASQMTRDALAGIEPVADIAGWSSRVRQVLAEVNAWLHGSATRSVNPSLSGTTVVVLLVRQSSAVCLWAGDSRLYRLRAGELAQLTRDHDDADANGAGSNVITRAIGGRPELELDEIGLDVRAGDRLLLCSDGLYREISAEEIATLLSSGDAMTAVESLVRRVLQGTAADNLTAVVVDVQPGPD